MAVVSADHGGEDLNPSHISISSNKAYFPRPFSPADIHKHNQQDDKSNFYAVIDGFVCDCSDFVKNEKAHPGGIKKLLSANAAKIGATGENYGFSFTRGRNAHFPKTGKTFQDGVRAYLKGSGDVKFGHLAPHEVKFEPWGKIVILGKLSILAKSSKTEPQDKKSG